jgi:hypothetical protein
MPTAATTLIVLGGRSTLHVASSHGGTPICRRPNVIFIAACGGTLRVAGPGRKRSCSFGPADVGPL